MDFQKQIDNLAKMVNSLNEKVDKISFYVDADITGARRDISGVTPHTFTKTAYIDDTEVIFKDVPMGNVTIYMTDPKGEYVPCSFARISNLETRLVAIPCFLYFSSTHK